MKSGVSTGQERSSSHCQTDGQMIRCRSAIIPDAENHEGERVGKASNSKRGAQVRVANAGSVLLSRHGSDAQIGLDRAVLVTTP